MLQPTIRKEIIHAGFGTVLGSGLIVGALYLLSRLGIGRFDYRVLAGAGIGSLMALGNFTLLCLTVQRASCIPESGRMRSFLQASYRGRLLAQGAWVAFACLNPHIHPFAGALPLLLPVPSVMLLRSRHAAG